ncbi:MAG: hypothetical protein QW416_08955 [Candidatus Nitrosocaldaceae archaeon]
MSITVVSRCSCYQIIFQQQYDFIQTAKTLEGALQRVNEFIFLLYARNDTITPILLIEAEKRELFNNVMHITLAEYNKEAVLDLLKSMRIYAKLKLKQHYAIPFAIVPEPFPLYRILADYYYNYDSSSSNSSNSSNNNSSSTTARTTTNTTTSILFALHARQRSERISIASYLRKHDLARTSTFYAYADSIRQKLQSTHYHCTLLLSCTDSKIALLKALTAFKVQYFAYFLKSNNNNNLSPIEKQRLARELFARPKKPLTIPYIRNPVRYPVLSSIELVSLMLPDSVKGVRTTVDGIRPYTTGTML